MIDPLQVLLSYSRVRGRAACAALLFTAVAGPMFAEEDKAAAAKRNSAGKPALPRGAEMDYGPALACSVGLELRDPNAAPPPDASIARKGLVVHLSGTEAAYACYDTDTLRLAAIWTGGFLKLDRTNIGTYKGEGWGAAEISGTLVIRSENKPGCATTRDFVDPRVAKAGPLPKAKARFKGHYVHGDRVVISYASHGCEVLESPGSLGSGDTRLFTRHFTIGPTPSPLQILLGKGETPETLSVSVVPPDVGTVWKTDAGQWALEIPAHQSGRSFAILLGRSAFPTDKADVAPIDLKSLCKGGNARWPQIITTTGTRGNGSDAYVVDDITLPEQNPWKSWMRVSALDFFSDGRAAIATLNGDVWIASGLDEELKTVQWKRFAAGLYEPLGLKISNGYIYVHGRDQITRLHDLNGDGEADYHECFNHDRTLYPNYHAFAFDLQTDSTGNFYYVVGGNQLGATRPWHAAVFRVSRDGKRTESIATGFRAPNGMGIGPAGEITVSDNQGHWIPSSKINLIKPGGFYGHVADPRLDAKASAPSEFDPPLCWIPMALDSSSGGQVWAPRDKWGPFSSKLLHTSYGKSALFAVLYESVDGTSQGGVVQFPLQFASGIMRLRFSPLDGQLYVAGMRGWQTNGSKDGCFQRVRYTGQPLRMPTALRVAREAVEIDFDIPLERNTATDIQNVSIEQYNYRWSSAYGSPELSVADGTKTGRDQVEVTNATLSADGKTVRLTIPKLQPVMQMEIKMQLKAVDGSGFDTHIANTINKIPASYR